MGLVHVRGGPSAPTDLTSIVVVVVAADLARSDFSSEIDRNMVQLSQVLARTPEVGE